MEKDRISWFGWRRSPPEFFFKKTRVSWPRTLTTTRATGGGGDNERRLHGTKMFNGLSPMTFCHYLKSLFALDRHRT